MNPIWRQLGITCRRDGIRQPQLLGIWKVPRVTPAATIEPINELELEYNFVQKEGYGTYEIARVE